MLLKIKKNNRITAILTGITAILTVQEDNRDELSSDLFNDITKLLSTKSSVYWRTFNSHYINYTVHSNNHIQKNTAIKSPLQEEKLRFLLQFISKCSCTVLLCFSHSFPGTPIYYNLFPLTSLYAINVSPQPIPHPCYPVHFSTPVAYTLFLSQFIMFFLLSFFEPPSPQHPLTLCHITNTSALFTGIHNVLHSKPLYLHVTFMTHFCTITSYLQSADENLYSVISLS